MKQDEDDDLDIKGQLEKDGKELDDGIEEENKSGIKIDDKDFFKDQKNTN